MINNVSDFLIPQTTSKWGISFFVVLGVVYGVSQYFIFRFVWWKTKYIRSKSSRVNSLLKIVILSQYALLAILIITIYQILFLSYYNTALLIWSTIISFLLSISILGILARQFLLWHRAYKRNSFVILCYTLAFMIIALTFSVALLLDMYNFSSKQGIVTPNSDVSFPDYDTAGRIIVVLHYIYDYADLVSFIFFWAATSLLLLHYRKRLGLLKFWIIISLPLVYYLGTLVDIVGVYEPKSDSERFYYYLYTSFNSTAGGIMFGIAFLVIAKRIDNERIKGYMTLASYGFIFLYISTQITLVACSYPPFGMTTLYFTGLSSFLLLTGLYSTAISLSQHAELRKSIRNSIKDQDSSLIDDIGMSEVQRDVDRKVAPLIQKYNEELDVDTSIDFSISDKEVKQYIREILTDLHKNSVLDR
jgi:hypothetical protein